MYVTMSIAFPLLIAASNIVTLFNARPLGAAPCFGLSSGAMASAPSMTTPEYKLQCGKGGGVLGNYVACACSR